jgi:hypothetical protein
MTPEAAFLKAWGREPSRLERERLRRLREAFAIDENDALLTIAMVLEFYDGIYRLYPEKCADAVRRVFSEGRSPAGTLPSPAPAPPAHRASSTERPITDWITLGGLLTTFMLLVGVGIAIGVALVAPPGYLVSLASRAAWIVAIIPIVYVGAWGWSRIRHATSKSNECRLGWAALTATGVAVLAWVLLLRAGTLKVMP